MDRLSADRAGTRSDGAEPPLMMPLSDIGADQLADVGGKALNLAELLRGGFRIPPGFCLTTHAYERVADQAGLGRRLDELAATSADDDPTLGRLADAIAGLVLAAPVPDEVATAVGASYRRLGPAVPVAVRSSATAEDLPFASFAGQQDTFLAVVGRDARAGRRTALLGVAVDPPRRRLPGAAGHRPAGGPPRRRGAAAWSTPRSPACCSPPTRSPAGGAQAVIDASPGPRRGGGVRRGQPRPLRRRHRQRRRRGAATGDKRLAIRPRPGGGTTHVERRRRRTGPA